MEDEVVGLKKALQSALNAGNQIAVQEAYGDLGRCFLRENHLAEALHCFEKLLATCGTKAESGTQDLKFKGVATCQIGLIYLIMAEFSKALEYCRKHLVISEQLGDVAAQGMAYSNMGTALENLGEREDALQCYLQALQIVERTGDIAGQGLAYASIGSLYSSLGEDDNALQYHRNSLSIAEACGDLEAQATAYSFIREIYQRKGELSKAVEYQQQELELAQRREQKDAESRALINLGELYCLMQDYARAQIQFQAGLALAKTLGERELEAQAYSGLGHMYDAQGKLARALEYHQQSLKHSVDIGNLALQGATHNDIGDVHFSMGHFRQSLQSHHSAWQILEQHSVDGRAVALNGMADSYYRLRDYQKALKLYQRLLDFSESEGDLSAGYITSACMGAGNTCHKLGNYDQAVEHFEQAMEVAEINADPDIQEMASFGAGHAYYMMQELDKAMECYQRAQALTRESGIVYNHCRAMACIATCWYAGQRFDSAVKVYKRALQVAESQREGAEPAANDDVLLGIVHSAIQHYRTVHLDATTEVLSTIHIYLWGLVAMLLNGSEGVTACALPAGLVSTAAAALRDATSTAPESPSMKSAPYVQYYAMYILYRLSTCEGMRPTMKTAEVFDGSLACLAFPSEVLARALLSDEKDGNSIGNPSGILQATLIATKTLRNLVTALVFGEEDARQMILNSPRLPTLLAALRAHTPDMDVNVLKQNVYILTLLAAVVEPEAQPSPRVSTHLTTSLRRRDPSPVVGQVWEAVAGFIAVTVTAGQCTELDLKALRLAFRLLMDLVRRGNPQDCPARALDPKALEAFIHKHLHQQGSSWNNGLELCKYLTAHAHAQGRPIRSPSKGPRDMVAVVHPLNASLRSASVLSNSSTRSASASVTHDTSATDTADTTTYESLSSQSSHCSTPRGLAHVNLTLCDDDDLFPDPFEHEEDDDWPSGLSPTWDHSSDGGLSSPAVAGYAHCLSPPPGLRSLAPLGSSMRRKISGGQAEGGGT
uniref:Tetratricopeptide repeat protein 28 n=1 Tax=Eutreptiella gymnastica TaxID=73025 RepID=A0A7S1IRW1_9EUGL|mmetsp:Transcript_38857/g.69547  ORF Transcript_38857/g.69547 Transcript_38857/m.69547 type:complete len:1001 (+) Transcript_38857:177-3179(+)